MSSIVEAGAEFNLRENKPKIEVKPRLPIEEIPTELRGKVSLTAEDIAKLSNLAGMFADKIDPNMNIQMVPKKQVPITDFSKLTQDDIYDPGLFIEAKPLMSGDPLKVELKDTNYEARWVNKKSERLGYMLTIGFTYVVPDDLAKKLNIEISGDAEGHFSFHDVVLMRVPKATYYPALVAAQQKAQRVVTGQRANSDGAGIAQNFMHNAVDDDGRAVGGDFSEYNRDGKLKFYTPAG